MRIIATDADLPREVLAALADPQAGAEDVIGGEDGWPTLSWGRPSDPPLLLVHGVTSSAGIWRRVGPALAAAGFRVTAVDMPGHGRAPRRGNEGWPADFTRFIDAARALARFI